MNHRTALEWLYALSPKGVCLGLDRVRRGAALLGDPQRQLTCVQVAGTNGKGTVSCLVAHFALRAGLRVGLFTSPHLHCFAERIRINSRPIADDELARHLTAIFTLFDVHDDLELTFFEVATLAAFCAFAEHRVDLAVLEVGLGGRLDATTICEPVITGITSIGLDHTEYLGDTIEQIASEKAGVIRSGVPLVTGDLPSEARAVVEQRARSLGAPLYRLGRDFEVPAAVRPPWPGVHQRQNAATALKIVSLLAETDTRFNDPDPASVVKSVTWPGRFELLQRCPSFLLDIAHNPDAITALLQSLDESSVHPELLIFGALRDKPIAQMLTLLRSRFDRVVLATPPIPRAFEAGQWALPGDFVAPSIEQAIGRAEATVPGHATVLVTGSLFVVAEIRRLLLKVSSDPPVGL